MGCWDEYCVVCGDPPSAPDRELDVFGDSPISEDEDEDEDEGPTSALHRRGLDFQAFEWLGSFVGINKTEEPIPLGEYVDFGYFHAAEGESRFGGATNVHFSHDVQPGLYGLMCHEKCYRVLERELQYTVRFSDVWPMLMKQGVGGHLVEYTNYGWDETVPVSVLLVREGVWG